MKYSKYSEVYQDNFLDIFRDNKKEVSDIQFENGDAFIDVEKIISICGIEIERQLSTLDSGSLSLIIFSWVRVRGTSSYVFLRV